jgi:hypothetical protein
MATELKDAPGSLVNTDNAGAPSWSNPGNAAASDNSYATVTISGASDWLDVTDFGFAIPSGATIDNVKVEAECKASAGFSGLVFALLLGGTTSPSPSTHGDNLDGAFVGTSDAYMSLSKPPGTGGLPSASWGTLVTDVQVNASTFGCRLRANYVGKSNVTVSIDHVRITVTYTGGAAAGKAPPPRRRMTRYFKQRG